MDCDELRERLIDVTTSDGASNEVEVRVHLRDCDLCQQRVRRANLVWSLLDTIPDEEPDSAALRMRFMGELSRFTTTPAHTNSRWGVMAWASSRPVGQAAAGVILFIGGLVASGYLPDRGAAGTPEVAATREEVRQLRGLLTLSLLQHGTASDRLKGVVSAAEMDAPAADVLGALVDTLRHDPDVNVRLAAVQTLERFRDRAATREGVRQALLDEESPLVSVMLIDFLAQERDSTLVAFLEGVSRDPQREEGVREAASEAVARMVTGGRL